MYGCDCGGCPDCLRAQGYDEDDEALETIAELILDEYLASPKWVGEAAASLTDAEYYAIDQAHAERDAMKLFAVRDAAIRRVLGKWAMDTARERLDKIRREAEADAFEMAMED